MDLFIEIGGIPRASQNTMTFPSLPPKQKGTAVVPLEQSCYHLTFPISTLCICLLIVSIFI